MKQSTVSVFSGSWPGIIVLFLYTVTDFRSLNPMHPLLQKKKTFSILKRIQSHGEPNQRFCVLSHHFLLY